MSTELSIVKTLKLPDLEDQLRFLEEGKYLVRRLVATKNTTDNTEFNTVTLDDRHIVLAHPLELFTTPSADQLDEVAAEKEGQGYSVIFLSDEVFVDGARVPVGAVRKEEVPSGLSWDSYPKQPCKDWSPKLIEFVQANKPDLEKGHADGFVAGYSGLTPTQQLRYWAELFISVAKFESGWDPTNTFREASGQNSIGLLQLSKSDQDNYQLTPRITDEDKLKDPILNLGWGVTIFAKRLARDGVVASGGKIDPKGAAKYWSTLQEGHKNDKVETLPEVKKAVKKYAGL
jgi:hypothetical protein